MVQFPFPQLWDSEKMAGGNNGGEKGSAPSALPPLMVGELWGAGLASTSKLGGQKGRSYSSLQSQRDQHDSGY